MHNNKPYLSSFGRNRGRSLRDRQQGLMEELLPTLTIHPDNAKAVIAHSSRIALEIGFGGGEHLASLASHHPETLYIGCEPYLNGVAKLLVSIEEQGLKNIRIFTDDARKLLEALPEGCIDEAFILFPDPWPKLRHNKRRLINAHTLAMLARLQQAGSRLLIATDHVDYAGWILRHLQASPHYEWLAEQQADWLTPPLEWAETKYQRKTSAQGRLPLFFECRRKNA